MPPGRLLPAELAALGELALDLRWSWNHAGDALWHALDPQLWADTRNPWAVLSGVSEARLRALAGDPDFRARVDAAQADRRRYLDAPSTFARIGGDTAPRGIAYFSMEFGLSEALPLYAGGLGVLAGDYLKTASDLGVPIVGIGLLYAQGYLRQYIDRDGRQQESYPVNDPARLPLRALCDADGEPLRVELPLPGRVLHLRAWQVVVGRTQLYLLDSDDPRNSATDRAITARLYGGGRETRLLQEIALGIGGWMLIDKLGLDIEICHINEGHAAFALLERARSHAVRHRLSFSEAWWATRAGNLFTTHTAVGAGFDAFDAGLLLQYAGAAAAHFGIAPGALMALGRRNAGDEQEPFHLAFLAMRGCAQVNAVSALHGRVSRRLFGDLYPRWPQHEVPVGHVTNGVHVPSWDSAEADALWTERCGKERWRGDAGQQELRLREQDDGALWQLAGAQRGALVDFVRQRLKRQRAQRGATPGEIAAADHVFDANVLTLGFARRFTGYKRPTLLLHDAERFARLLRDSARPMQIVVAGLAHPADAEGKAAVRQWIDYASRSDLADRVVFLDGYDLTLAQNLVQGVDVWLNTPRRRFEACGTSGMKVLVNGGLNLSIRDGWWDEAYTPDAGWGIDGGGAEDAASCDDDDAAAIYELLEREVAPAFYARDAEGLPRGWLRRMRASITGLTPRYSSHRMLLEYLDDWYRPATQRYRRRCADDSARPRALRLWRQRLVHGWSQIHLGDCSVEPGAHAREFRVPVYLGDIDPRDIAVELYADATAGAPSCERIAMTCGAAIAGSVNGFLYGAEVPGSRPASDYTARVLPAHEDAVLPIELPMIRWQR